MPGRRELTLTLRRATAGSPAAVDELFEACYAELRRLAHKCLAGERPEHTLQTTALVHEAYLRLVDAPHLDWKNRAHFFAVASRVMRRILVDYARRRQALKRSGRLRRVPLDEAVTLTMDSLDPTLSVDIALSRLQEEVPEKARVIEMRYFAGMTHDEIAEVLGLSSRTVRRYAAYAQARLYEMMQSKPL